MSSSGKSEKISFRCPAKLLNKIFELKNDRGKSKTDLLLLVLRTAFNYQDLFNAIVDNCTDRQKESIIGKAIDKMDLVKRGDVFEFSELFKRENQKTG